VEVLRAELKKDPENARGWFYLGQALEQQGDWAGAFDAYYRRVLMSEGSREEIWFAVYRLGHCLLQNGTSIEGAARYYLDAYNFDPTRREPLYALMRNYRLAGKYATCRLFGVAALSIPFPANNPLAIGIELPLYEYATPEELAACLYELNEKKTALDLLERVMNATQISFGSQDKERVTTAIAFIKKELVSA
jgi:tetratricopeptide (TPR) repeat protein